MDMAKATPRYKTAGELFRAVRNQKGVSQKKLAQEIQEHGHSPDHGDISKLENGLRRPKLEWLEAALQTLKASYPQYQDVMDAFGYPPRMTLPTDEEIRLAKAKVADILKAHLYPVYFADCAFHILDWNRPFAMLSPDHSEREWFRNVSMIDAMFATEHPQRSFASLVANPEEFFPQQLRMLYHEWQQAREEDWCKKLLARHLYNPFFREAWEAAGQSTAMDAKHTDIDTRLRVPLRLRLMPGAAGAPTTILSFHILVEPFAEDRRFRLIVFQASDALTIRQCLTWADEKP
jgi:transcriptional regulator with XRE-family HTH domain